MSLGFSTTVINRLWKLVDSIMKGKTRKSIMKELEYDLRCFNGDIHRLKCIGLKMRYSRSMDKYSLEFPEKTVAFKFTPEEFFWIYYTLKNVGDDKKYLNSKLELALSDDSDPVFDCGPAYGITQNITEGICPLISHLKNAISSCSKIVFSYKSRSSDEALRVVHPYRLIHTPVSWYLVAYCEDRNDFRNFKISRMTQLKMLRDTFSKKAFNLTEHLGDAWWLRHDPTRKKNPYKVAVLFKNEAAKNIYEYKFHSSQEWKRTDNGTLVTWKLSYLEEFASWLMQWLPDLEIQNPKELKNIISSKINSYN